MQTIQFPTSNRPIPFVGEVQPRVNLSESLREYKVSMELPGVTGDEIEVVLSRDLLFVRGEKARDAKAEDVSYHAVEREYGYFYRTIPFPSNVVPERSRAVLENGVLTVCVEKEDCYELC